MKNKYLIFILILCLLSIYSNAQTNNKSDHQDEKMEWFSDAKLGIFIHWGIYSVDGIDESWSFYNGYISHEDYLKQTKGFTAANYDPEYWAELIKKSGAKYSVITAKHHDGFALWDTRYGNFNAVNHSAAKRDLLTPFMKQLKKHDIRKGIYFSLPDWSYEDYTHFTREQKRYENDSIRWKKYLNYAHGQINELSKKYDPDLLWFDGDWEHSANEWQSAKIRKMLIDHNPDIIINSRLTGYGDYATPEQGQPVTRPTDRYWELCMTINDSWGYQKNDHHYKSPKQIIWLFADVISMGGNLLLDIGPKADGTIPEKQVEVLECLGRWTNKHQEAIYGTKAGIPKEHFSGPSTLSEDENILYLFVKGNPDRQVILKGLKNKINRIWVVGKGTKLEHEVFGKVYWSQYPGIKYINVPDYVLDEYMTVIAVLLDGPVKLYREDVKKIESN